MHFCAKAHHISQSLKRNRLLLQAEKSAFMGQPLKRPLSALDQSSVKLTHLAFTFWLMSLIRGSVKNTKHQKTTCWCWQRNCPAGPNKEIGLQVTNKRTDMLAQCVKLFAFFAFFVCCVMQLLETAKMALWWHVASFFHSSTSHLFAPSCIPLTQTLLFRATCLTVALPLDVKLLQLRI